MGILIFFVFLIQLFSYWIFKNIVSSVNYIFDVKMIPFFLIIVFAFILAAVITPTPDPMTQSLMAVPMILLYELGLVAARLLLPKKKAQTTDLTEQDAP